MTAAALFRIGTVLPKSRNLFLASVLCIFPYHLFRFTIDGRIVVRYSNGDIKETATDGTITYYYFETGATQIMFATHLLELCCLQLAHLLDFDSIDFQGIRMG